MNLNNTEKLGTKVRTFVVVFLGFTAFFAGLFFAGAFFFFAGLLFGGL